MRLRELLRALVPAATMALLAVAGHSAAPAGAVPLLTITKIEAVGENPPSENPPPPRVSARVKVVRPDRVPIDKLTAKDFRVNVDGQPFSGFEVQQSQNKSVVKSVALAIDTSGSMEGDKLLAAKQAAHTFVGLLGDNDWLAVIQVGGDAPCLLQPLSTDHKGALAAIDGLQAKGWTPLWRATDQAISIVDRGNAAATIKPCPGSAAGQGTATGAPITEGPRTVLVVTDGKDELSDNTNSLTLGTVTTHAQQSNVPVYTVGLGMDVSAEPLGDLANDTHGQYLESPTPEQLTGTFAEVARLLQVEYVISFDGPILNQPTRHTLDVTVDADGGESVASQTYSVPGVVSRTLTTVALVSPADGSQTSDDVRIEANLKPQMSVQGARFLVDGKEIGKADKPPYATVWHTKGATTADHTVRVEATNADGGIQKVEAKVHYIDPHVTVRLVSPRAGQQLSGNARFQADVNPTPSVRSVRYLVDGQPVGNADQPPFALSWSAKSVLIGAHQVRVEATGADGQTETAIADIKVVTGPNPIAQIVGGVAAILATLGLVLIAMNLSRKRRRRLAYAGGAGAAGGMGAMAGGVGRSGSAGANGAGGPSGAPALLMEVGAGGAGREWPLPDEVLVGRDVPSGNIWIDDPDVSRTHARIARAGPGYVWQDLSPTNPTLINGATLAGPHALVDGDEIVVGSTHLAFLARRPAGARR